MPPRRVADLDWSAWTPRDTATLLFVTSGGRCLLIRKKRGLGAGKINAPGGRVEPGETPLDGAVREVQEEVRVTPLEPSVRGDLSFQFLDGYSIHAYVFIAPGCIGVPIETAEAVPRWTPIGEIPYRQMWADDELWVPLLLGGAAFAGRFLFDGERMLDHQVWLLGAEALGELQGRVTKTSAA